MKYVKGATHWLAEEWQVVEEGLTESGLSEVERTLLQGVCEVLVQETPTLTTLLMQQDWAQLSMSLRSMARLLLWLALQTAARSALQSSITGRTPETTRTELPS